MAKQQFKQTDSICIYKKAFSLFDKHLRRIASMTGFEKPFRDESSYIRKLIDEDIKKNAQQ